MALSEPYTVPPQNELLSISIQLELRRYRSMPAYLDLRMLQRLQSGWISALWDTTRAFPGDDLGEGCHSTTFGLCVFRMRRVLTYGILLFGAVSLV